MLQMVKYGDCPSFPEKEARNIVKKIFTWIEYIRKVNE